MTTGLKAIIVDDEAYAIDLFKSVLKMTEYTFSEIGEARSLPEAVKLINERKPDVVFMDIEMPGYTGLQMNDFFPSPRKFEVVFITAHQQHVLDAMRIEAFDYLFKPISPEDLDRCLRRLIEKNNHQASLVKTESKERKKKITISSHKGIEFINIEDIFYLEASGMYCIVHSKKGELVVSKPLGEFDYLEEEKFYRIHRSYIVNTAYVERINLLEGNEIQLVNGMTLNLARNRKEGFKNFMNQYYGV